MPLSDDQRALLRLLAQREEGYEDIAALLGLSVDEVRARVRDALLELDGAAPAPPAPATPEPPPEPEGAPTPPEPSAEPPRARRRPSLRARPSLPSRATARLAIAGGAAALLLVVVVLATGVLGGDGEEGPSPGGGGEATAGAEPGSAAGAQQPTYALLRAADGGDAAGQAVFGRLDGRVLLVVAARGLDPSPQGRAYAVSLAGGPAGRVPVAAAQVGRSGTLAGQFPIPTEALGLLAGGYDEMVVSLVSNSELRAALLEAQRQGAVPDFGGTDVLRGRVVGPVVGAAGR